MMEPLSIVEKAVDEGVARTGGARSGSGDHSGLALWTALPGGGAGAGGAAGRAGVAPARVVKCTGWMW